MRGLAGRVQVLKDAAVVAEHPRGTDALLLRDEAHYEGPVQVSGTPTGCVRRCRRDTLGGRMGRRLQEIAASNVQHRSIELYARLAEVAR